MSQGYVSTFPPPSGETFSNFTGKTRTNQSAINTFHSGISAPVAPETNQAWLDTSTTPAVLKIWDGAAWQNWENYIAILKEVKDARGTAANLDTRLDVSINEDGTLKASTSLSPSEWVDVAGTPTKTGATTFTMTGDKTAVFVAKRRVKMSPGPNYGTVASSSYSAPTTTVTLDESTVPDNISAVFVAILTPTAASTAVNAKSIPSPSGGQIEDYLAEIVTARAGLTDLATRLLRKNRAPRNLLKNGDVELWAGGTAAAPDGWTLAGALATVAQEATVVKRSTYSAKVTRAGTDCQLKQDALTPAGTAYIKSRTYTVGAWVYATVASRVRLYLDDGVTVTYSSYHAGNSAWAFLTVTKTLAANATALIAALQVDTGDTSGYLDGAILVEGDEAYAFSPHPWDLGTQIPVLAKTGAYTLLVSDRNRLIDATSGTWTLSLPAAATAGDGFWFAVKAGSGTITVDPNASEQIDGATTLALAPGDEAIIVCNGAAWRTISRYVASSASLETGTWTADLAGGSRAAATEYQNTSGKKRRVSIAVADSSGDCRAEFQANSSSPVSTRRAINGANATGGGQQMLWCEVPNNWYYKLVITSGSLQNWWELDE